MRVEMEVWKWRRLGSTAGPILQEPFPCKKGFPGQSESEEGMARGARPKKAQKRGGLYPSELALLESFIFRLEPADLCVRVIPFEQYK